MEWGLPVLIAAFSSSAVFATNGFRFVSIS